MYRFLMLSVVYVLATTSAQGESPGPKPSYSPYAELEIPEHVYFGDVHVHSSYSHDAGMVGNTLSPTDAYRFARGQTVISSTGVPARLIQPLDFLMVSDHAESLGLAPLIARSDPTLLKDPLGKALHDLVKEGTDEARGEAFNLYKKSIMAGTNNLAISKELPVGPWEEIVDAAEAANDPGRFTAFIGFEWSSSTPKGSLHRVVVFRDGKDVGNAQIPLSSALDPNPEALWEWMAGVEASTGGRLLAIPHNGNQSNGMMFDDVLFESEVAITADYARKRQRWEPLYETTQIKGDGEAHPLLSTDDEFADFETWDAGNPAGRAKTPDMLPREYSRTALARGLAYEAKLGVNPFKFGLVGSSDTHTSLSSTREDNFFGKVTPLEPSADPIRFQEPIMGRIGGNSAITRAWQTSASGLTGVWAKENTRAAIWDAMKRREVYATTGTRLKVRLFAGWGFEERDLLRSDFAQNGYGNGVPMGGDLSGPPKGGAPRFLIQAMRDANGANLDRVQIIKGWVDAEGNPKEKVYDVAVSGGREIEPDGRCRKTVGNTVNVAEATYSNEIGDVFLSAYWSDPAFKPEQHAVYYVRVLEIPTPRWTTYDAKVFGVKIPKGAPTSIQERAYTSPIWYTPK